MTNLYLVESLQSINQSKHISIAPHVASESEAHTKSTVRIMIWRDSVYAHVFILSVVVVTLPWLVQCCDWSSS